MRNSNMDHQVELSMPILTVSAVETSLPSCQKDRLPPTAPPVSLENTSPGSELTPQGGATVSAQTL